MFQRLLHVGVASAATVAIWRDYASENVDSSMLTAKLLKLLGTPDGEPLEIMKDVEVPRGLDEWMRFSSLKDLLVDPAADFVVMITMAGNRPPAFLVSALPDVAGSLASMIKATVGLLVLSERQEAGGDCHGFPPPLPCEAHWPDRCGICFDEMNNTRPIDSPELTEINQGCKLCCPFIDSNADSDDAWTVVLNKLRTDPRTNTWKLDAPYPTTPGQNPPTTPGQNPPTSPGQNPPYPSSNSPSSDSKMLSSSRSVSAAEKNASSPQWVLKKRNGPAITKMVEKTSGDAMEVHQAKAGEAVKSLAKGHLRITLGKTDTEAVLWKTKTELVHAALGGLIDAHLREPMLSPISKSPPKYESPPIHHTTAVSESSPLPELPALPTAASYADLCEQLKATGAFEGVLYASGEPLPEARIIEKVKLLGRSELIHVMEDFATAKWLGRKDLAAAVLGKLVRATQTDPNINACRYAPSTATSGNLVNALFREYLAQAIDKNETITIQAGEQTTNPPTAPSSPSSWSTRVSGTPSSSPSSPPSDDLSGVAVMGALNKFLEARAFSAEETRSLETCITPEHSRLLATLVNELHGADNNSLLRALLANDDRRIPGYDFQAAMVPSMKVMRLVEATQPAAEAGQVPRPTPLSAHSFWSSLEPSEWFAPQRAHETEDTAMTRSAMGEFAALALARLEPSDPPTGGHSYATDHHDLAVPSSPGLECYKSLDAFLACMASSLNDGETGGGSSHLVPAPSYPAHWDPPRRATASHQARVQKSALDKARTDYKFDLTTRKSPALRLVRSATTPAEPAVAPEAVPTPTLRQPSYNRTEIGTTPPVSPSLSWSGSLEESSFGGSLSGGSLSGGSLSEGSLSEGELKVEAEQEPKRFFFASHKAITNDTSRVNTPTVAFLASESRKARAAAPAPGAVRRYSVDTEKLIALTIEDSVALAIGELLRDVLAKSAVFPVVDPSSSDVTRKNVVAWLNPRVARIGFEITDSAADIVASAPAYQHLLQLMRAQSRMVVVEVGKEPGLSTEDLLSREALTKLIEETMIKPTLTAYSFMCVDALNENSCSNSYLSLLQELGTHARLIHALMNPTKPGSRPQTERAQSGRPREPLPGSAPSQTATPYLAVSETSPLDIMSWYRERFGFAPLYGARIPDPLADGNNNAVVESTRETYNRRKRTGQATLVEPVELVGGDHIALQLLCINMKPSAAAWLPLAEGLYSGLALSPLGGKGLGTNFLQESFDAGLLHSIRPLPVNINTAVAAAHEYLSDREMLQDDLTFAAQNLPTLGAWSKLWNYLGTNADPQALAPQNTTAPVTPTAEEQNAMNARNALIQKRKLDSLSASKPRSGAAPQAAPQSAMKKQDFQSRSPAGVTF